MSESSEDDDDQLKTVHLLSSENICKVTEPQLTDDRSTGCSNLDSSVGVGRDGSVGLAVVEEHNTQHSSDQVDGEDLNTQVRTVSMIVEIGTYIVGISKETNASNHTSSHMIPAKWGFVDFGESKSTTLIGILDVSEVIVEVVEGGVSTSRLLEDRSRSHCV